ncbi:MAG: ABC transporter ATP-binding protein [Planctomycetota bacterium]|jgi:ABC-type multidrug transport system fused ATPase/permease subunit
MKAFKRVFKYVWPQWHRLVTVGCSALLVGTLFSFSIATVLPLLKVMMGEEGLHGWINRSTSEDRYGVSFYVPDSVDLSDPNKPDIAYHLRIVEVKKGGFAEQAGLEREDLIVGAGSSLIGERADKIPSNKLLWELATIGNVQSMVVQYRRLEPSGEWARVKTELQCDKKPFYADFAQRALRYIPREQTRENKKRAVVFIILLMLVVTAVRCIARFYQDYMVQKVVDTSLARLREDAFRHSLDIPAGFFANEGPSNTVSKLLRDTGLIGIGIKALLGKTLREPLKAIGMIAAAMWIDRKLTLIFLCGAPGALYAISRLGRKIKRATKKSLASWAKMLGKLQETMESVKVIKVYNRQEHEGINFTGLNRKLLKQQFRIAKVDASTEPLLETLGMIAGCAGLVFGAHWVYKGTMQASDFFVLIILLGASAESIRKTSDVWNKLQQANAGAERVFNILDEPVEPEREEAIELAPLREKIEFRDIVFTYPGTGRPVLKGVTLGVRAGHNVAIVGPNGSGKTTLANLMPRFYDPDSGQILIDGRDIREATLYSLRSQIGMVTQNVVTFHDTIGANIAYGKPGATREEIIEAAKRSFSHEFISPLPKGYDTIIGEHGAGLSGGQLQRIVIARAIVKNPAILIFDEATSQVDADSEAKIHRAIEEIMQDRTSFIIAHRFSTVITADLIVVMDDGRIIAQGQHEELMQSCPLYQSLYETQLVKA